MTVFKDQLLIHDSYNKEQRRLSDTILIDINNILNKNELKYNIINITIGKVTRTNMFSFNNS